MFIRSRSPGPVSPRSRATRSPRPWWSRSRCDTSCTQTPASSSTGVAVHERRARRSSASAGRRPSSAPAATPRCAARTAPSPGTAGPGRRAAGRRRACRGPASPWRGAVIGRPSAAVAVRAAARSARRDSDTAPASRSIAAGTSQSSRRSAASVVAGTTTRSGAPVSSARTSSAQAASQRAFVRALADRGHHAVEHGLAQVAPLGQDRPPPGRRAASRGPGRSIRSRLASSSSPGPSPTVPRTSRDSTSREAPAAVAKAISRSAISQLRGDGQAPPRRGSLLGSWCTSPGRAVRSPHTARRANATASASRSGSSRGSDAARPGAAEAADHDVVVVGPLEMDEPVGQRRAQVPAVGGARTAGWRRPRSGRRAAAAARRPAVPARAAAAPPGRPAARWTARRGTAAPGRPARAARPSPAGPSGHPAPPGRRRRRAARRSRDGSWTLAMTVVSGRSRAAASWVRAAVLPMPGSPHSSTGRSAATARVRASSWVSGRGSVVGVAEQGQQLGGDVELGAWAGSTTGVGRQTGCM